MHRFPTVGAAFAGVLAFCAGNAAAQIAVSANDGKQPRLWEAPGPAGPDTVSVIDLAQYPPSVIGTVQVPVSMIGPPASVAVSRDESFAIVTAAQRFDPADDTQFVLDGTVSVIDLADPRRPIVVQTVTAGEGASGVSINRDGTLALVASTGAGTVSAYAIAGKRLTPVGTLQLDPDPGPVDVAISPDGKTALVTQRRGSAIWRLAIDGTRVTDTGVTYATGDQPYGVVFSQDGAFAYNTNLLGDPRPTAAGQGPRIGTVTVIDLKKNAVVTAIDVGPTPEHLALSPDGKYLEVTVVNGSSADPASSNYNAHGIMKIFRVDGARLTQVAETQTGAWGQGAVWSHDGGAILFQGAIDKSIAVYRFDGVSLTRDAEATLQFDTRPGAIGTAWAR